MLRAPALADVTWLGSGLSGQGHAPIADATGPRSGAWPIRRRSRRGVSLSGKRPPPPYPTPPNARTQRNMRTNQHVRRLKDRDSLRTNARLADASSTEELAGAGLGPTPRECLAKTKLVSIGSVSSQNSRSRKRAYHLLWASKARRSNID